MPLFRREPIRDQFTTCGLGDLFVLRLAGFVNESRVKLLDVSPQSARMLVGGRTWGEWFRGDEFMPRAELRLHFVRTTDGRTNPVEVSVEILPRGLKPRNFRAVSKHLARRVRAYFVAV